MTFRLKIYDNYHYMDESESYVTGHFDSCAEAVAEAKSVVSRFIDACVAENPVITAEALLGMYRSFGEDPAIIAEAENNAPCGFSAWDYAEHYVEECLQNKQASVPVSAFQTWKNQRILQLKALLGMR